MVMSSNISISNHGSGPQNVASGNGPQYNNNANGAQINHGSFVGCTGKITQKNAAIHRLLIGSSQSLPWPG